MTLTQLRAFLLAARLGSFTAAAACLQMSQPAISDLVRRLEAELKAALFRRRPKSLTLTPAGEALLPYAEQAVSNADMGAKAVRSLATLSGGQASFGLLRNANFYLSADLAARFHHLYPKVQIRLLGQNSVETANDVRSGVLEAGLVTLPIDTDGLDVLPVARDEVLYVTARPERAASPVTIHDLCRRPLVLYDAHYAERDPARCQLARRAELIGRKLSPLIEVEYLPAALDMVAAGLGDTIACAASKASEIDTRQLHTVTFAEPLYDTLAVIRRRGELISPASREFARLAVKSLLDNPARVDSLTLLINDSTVVENFLTDRL